MVTMTHPNCMPTQVRSLYAMHGEHQRGFFRIYPRMVSLEQMKYRSSGFSALSITWLCQFKSHYEGATFSLSTGPMFILSLSSNTIKIVLS